MENLVEYFLSLISLISFYKFSWKKFIQFVAIKPWFLQYMDFMTYSAIVINLPYKFFLRNIAEYVMDSSFWKNHGCYVYGEKNSKERGRIIIFNVVVVDNM